MSPKTKKTFQQHEKLARQFFWHRQLYRCAIFALGASFLGYVLHLPHESHFIGLTVGFVLGFLWRVRKAQQQALHYIEDDIGLSYSTVLELQAQPQKSPFYPLIATRAENAIHRLEPPNLQPWWLPILVCALLLLALPHVSFNFLSPRLPQWLQISRPRISTNRNQPNRNNTNNFQTDANTDERLEPATNNNQSPQKNTLQENPKNQTTLTEQQALEDFFAKPPQMYEQNANQKNMGQDDNFTQGDNTSESTSDSNSGSSENSATQQQEARENPNFASNPDNSPEINSQSESKQQANGSQQGTSQTEHNNLEQNSSEQTSETQQAGNDSNPAPNQQFQPENPNDNSTETQTTQSQQEHNSQQAQQNNQQGNQQNSQQPLEQEDSQQAENQNGNQANEDAGNSRQAPRNQTDNADDPDNFMAADAENNTNNITEGKSQPDNSSGDNTSDDNTNSNGAGNQAGAENLEPSNRLEQRGNITKLEAEAQGENSKVGTAQNRGATPNSLPTGNSPTDYQKGVERTLNEGNIPVSYQEIVRKYFDTLE